MALNFSDFDASLHSSVIDGLKDQLVHAKSLVALERKAKDLEGVSETLHSDTDRSVTHVAILCLRDGVEVAVNHAVEVLGDALGYTVQGLIIE